MKHSTKKPPAPMNETEAKAKVIALTYEQRRIRNLLGDQAVQQIKEVGEGGGYEIVSPDGRTIEVKGTKDKRPNYGFVFNSTQELKHLEEGGYVYRITDVFGSQPHIYILSKNHLRVTPRYRADVRIVKGSRHELVVLEELTDQQSLPPDVHPVASQQHGDG